MLLLVWGAGLRGAVEVGGFAQPSLSDSHV